MMDMQDRLEKVRVQIAECEIIRDLATDPRKRELFGRLADHHKVLAGDLEKALQNARCGNGETFADRNTRKPFPRRDGQP
ncbi:hypothetical protein JQ617_10375 [Bradyrhizobium sp. KB893862 SZCCT0404]|uniref:hypothetical protein n=1 Tax=Bradyrhizobium sp. KB893862 SZCCT0404 TaxID=2807672 RepID=UPI001BA6FAFD|nr:hypothetical protein [Bradyrhizobium sp. KB893862 SZCCT0404]MBR1174358.1 hypothetical protein [Bradyrhizobium sp. KB893862 SZCCT0404]